MLFQASAGIRVAAATPPSVGSFSNRGRVDNICVLSNAARLLDVAAKRRDDRELNRWMTEVRTWALTRVGEIPSRLLKNPVVSCGD
jgi:hypothetical protein